MPKIIIRENDYTQAGTPDYSNSTVLIAGFAKDGVEKGKVFELSTQKDFVDEVSNIEPFTETTGTDGKNTKTVKSYGNKIAYELLGLGYPVIYKVITDVADMEKDDFWEEFKDKASYDFRYIMTGLLTDNKKANDQIIALANFDAKAAETDIFSTGRGDCIALCDIDKTKEAVTEIIKNSATKATKESEATTQESTSTESGSTPNESEAAGGESENNTNESGNATKYSAVTASKYAAYFAPSFCIKGYESPKNSKGEAIYADNIFPASFYYLACAKRASLNNFDEWFAVAGYTRGVADFAIASTSTNYGEIAIHKLQARTATGSDVDSDIAVNLIANFRGNYYLWGNRTAEKLDKELKASHFLNIRQLCTTLKKQIYVACRRFTFDPNSDVLWINFCNAITPTLERMKNNQGIENFVIERVDTDLKATLKAKIRITPIEAVEDFDIELALEDSMGTTNANISE